MRRSLPFISLSIVALSVIGCAGEKTYYLAINVKPGDKFNYSVRTGDGSAEPINMTMSVDKVRNDVTTFRIKIDPSSVPGGSDPMLKGMIEKVALILDLDKRGRAVGKMRSEGMPPGFENMAEDFASPNFATFPDRPVKVGDSWSGLSIVGNKNVSATYQLKSIEDIGGRKIAVLEIPPFPGEFKMDGPASAKVDLATGMPNEIKISGTQGKEKFSISMTERK